MQPIKLKINKKEFQLQLQMEIQDLKTINENLKQEINNYHSELQQEKNDNANRHQKIINLENEIKMSKYL